MTTSNDTAFEDRIVPREVDTARHDQPGKRAADTEAPPLAYARPGMRRLVPEFSPFLASVLTLCTAGVFALFWFNEMHGRLPKVRRDDPSARRAFWGCLIPVYNLYWIFFTVLRLVERVDELRVLRGIKPTGLRPLAITMCVSFMVPYYNLLVGVPVLGTLFAWYMQRSLNELAAVDAPDSESQATIPTYP